MSIYEGIYIGMTKSASDFPFHVLPGGSNSPTEDRVGELRDYYGDIDPEEFKRRTRAVSTGLGGVGGGILGAGVGGLAKNLFKMKGGHGLPMAIGGALGTLGGALGGRHMGGNMADREVGRLGEMNSRPDSYISERLDRMDADPRFKNKGSVQDMADIMIGV